MLSNIVLNGGPSNGRGLGNLVQVRWAGTVGPPLIVACMQKLAFDAK